MFKSHYLKLISVSIPILFKVIMRSFFIFLLSLAVLSAHGQSAWVQRADYIGGERWETVGFSIGDKGYFAFGSQRAFLFEYDPEEDLWTEKAMFPDGGRSELPSFVIGTKAYMGGGMATAGGVPWTFWEYDQTTDHWTERTWWGVWVEDHAAFSIGNKGYICGGWDGNTNRSDLWEYDPETDSWTDKAPFANGQGRWGAVTFTIGDYAYMGTGYDSIGVHKKDFWRYDPVSDSWTQVADFGGVPRREAVAFSINNKGYVGTGISDGQVYENDFWEYDPVTDIWTRVDNLPTTGRGVAASFSIGNRGFVGTGGSYNETFDDLWEFNPRAVVNDVEEHGTGFSIAVYPNPSTDQVNFSVPMSHEGGNVLLFNAQGQRVRDLYVQPNCSLSVDRKDIGAGVFFYQFILNGITVSSGKFLIVE